MGKYNIILIEGSCADNCLQKILDGEYFSFFKIDNPGVIQIFDVPEPALIICRMDQGIEYHDIKRVLKAINPSNSIPVLSIISPNKTESYLQSFMTGISHHISPPFNRDFLYSKIFNLLGGYIRADGGRTEFDMEFNNLHRKISLPNENISGFLISALENSIYKDDLIGKASESLSLKDESDTKDRIDKYNIRLELKRAIENDEFVLYYQPVVSSKDNSLYSFEALLRWNHPERGFLSPQDYIEDLENSPLIIPAGFLVIEKAVAQLKRWHEKFKYPLKMSINLSPRQFTFENLYDKILETVDSFGISHEHISFEITESVFATDMEAANLMLLKLRAEKFNIYMDDFGTGYSSLSYLYHFPVNVIKIDKSFVRWMRIDETSEHIVRAVTSLAHDLNLKVIAEGAESIDHITYLNELGVDYVQGYYYSKPLSEEDSDKYIAKFLQKK